MNAVAASPDPLVWWDAQGRKYGSVTTARALACLSPEMGRGGD